MITNINCGNSNYTCACKRAGLFERLGIRICVCEIFFCNPANKGSNLPQVVATDFFLKRSSPSETPVTQRSSRPCYSAVSTSLTNPLPDCSNYSSFATPTISFSDTFYQIASYIFTCDIPMLFTRCFL